MRRPWLLLSLLALAACGAPDEPAPPADPVTQAQMNDDPPPGCGSWDQLSTPFIERCLLWGGVAHCTGAAVWCCRDESDGGEHCTQDPPRAQRPIGLPTTPPLAPQQSPTAPTPLPPPISVKVL